MNNLQILKNLETILEDILSAYDAFEESNKTNRRWWVRPLNLTRDKEGFFKTCTSNLLVIDEEDFFVATRMSVDNFNVLLNYLEPALTKYSRRKAIPPKARLALTLLYLAQGINFKMLALSHKMGSSTVRSIIYETCTAIWSVLSPLYLQPPKSEEWQQIADDFYRNTGMPNCVGSIDGKHVKIACPHNSGSLYYNYKNTFSVILLAACDSYNKFTFVDVGAYGSQSDGGVFANSGFGKKILNDSIGLPEDCELPNSVIKFPFYFVGDNAFPLKRNLMRPFPGRNLPEDRMIFNKKLSKARVRIEHTFGILTNRWRVLTTTIHAVPQNVDKIILATTVLHNFLTICKDPIYMAESDDLSTDNNLTEATGANRSNSEAFNLRQTLAGYLHY